ncbi:YciI family protein [Haloechinothrix salitolerans]|uniref:YciI family protein n=1 Tax=Haloechinothrix salitolerans TaxID=926830 RepID=A0ABW2BT26_9PSEU
MAWYLVEIRYEQDKMPEVRPRHREFLAGLAEQGTVAIAGPLADDSGGVVLIEAADLDALHQIIDKDPYYLEGAIAERSVREFKPVLGSWVPG